MGNSSGQAIAVPSGHQHLHLVCSEGRTIAPLPALDAELRPVIRRVIRAMTEAHPSTLIEELLGPLRQLQLQGLPDNTDDLATRIAQEINVALLQRGADRAAVRRTALRWLARMDSNGREPARQQYRDLLSLVG